MLFMCIVCMYVYMQMHFQRVHTMGGTSRERNATRPNCKYVCICKRNALHWVKHETAPANDTHTFTHLKLRYYNTRFSCVRLCMCGCGSGLDTGTWETFWDNGTWFCISHHQAKRQASEQSKTGCFNKQQMWATMTTTLTALLPPPPPLNEWVAGHYFLAEHVCINKNKNKIYMK